jgi:hypothetical protein
VCNRLRVCCKPLHRRINDAGINRRCYKENPILCSCSAHEYGRALARPVTVRSAGAVPSTIAATMRGDREARGTSRRMCRSPCTSAEGKSMARKKQSYVKGTFTHRRTEADYMGVLLADCLDELRMRGKAIAPLPAIGPTA